MKWSRRNSSNSANQGNQGRATNPRSATAPARVEALEDRTLLTVFTVTNTNDSGAGSLRWAIDQSNNNPGIDTVAFNITSPNKVIHVASEMSGVYDAAIIDGTTQPGYAGKPLIQVDGAGTASNVDGIKLFGGCTLKGLSITNFGGQGTTTLPHNAGGNTIAYCWLGLDLNGNAAGNHAHGVGLFTANNTVDHCVASGNGADGIFVLGGLFGDAAPGNTIQYNLVGTDPTGTAARGNGANGIAIQASPGNWILHNVSDSNGNDGIILTGSGSSGEVVKGNTVGLSAAGDAPLGNAWYGIEISGPNNTIGGAAAADRNLFANSGQAGMVFYTSSAYGNVALGNYVGTDATGTKAMGNHEQGIAFASAGANQIGGLGAGEGNIVAASWQVGVGIFPGSGEVIRGNTFGAGSDGRALPNAGGDLFVSSDSSNNVINSNKGPGTVAPPPAAPQLQSAASRRAQGSAAYDVALPLSGATGIECRSVAGGMTVVLTFDKAIASATAAVSAGSATISGAAAVSGNTVTVNLANIANAQTITLTLASILAADGGSAAGAAVSFRVLQGDVNGNGSVTAADVNLVKAATGAAVGADNFRADVNASGSISGSDVNVCKSFVGTSAAAAVAAAASPAVAASPALAIASGVAVDATGSEAAASTLLTATPRRGHHRHQVRALLAA